MQHSNQKRVLRNLSNLNSGYATQMNSQIGTSRIQASNSKTQFGTFQRNSSSRNTGAGLSKINKGNSAVTLNLMNSPSIKNDINMMKTNPNQKIQGTYQYLISEPSAQNFQFSSKISSRNIPITNRPYGHSSGYGNFAESR